MKLKSICYVSELYNVYNQKTGDIYVIPVDLQAQPKLKRNLNNQRKSYYSIEIIY